MAISNKGNTLIQAFNDYVDSKPQWGSSGVLAKGWTVISTFTIPFSGSIFLFILNFVFY